MTQHTPGPWTVGSQVGGPNGVFVGEGDNRKAVAMLTGTFVPRNGYAVDEGDDGWTHERTANAALIAAAPAMLEALRETMAALTDITNAAENGEAYTFEELAKETFQKPINDAFLAITAAEGNRYAR